MTKEVLKYPGEKTKTEDEELRRNFDRKIK